VVVYRCHVHRLNTVTSDLTQSVTDFPVGTALKPFTHFGGFTSQTNGQSRLLSIHFLYSTRKLTLKSRGYTSKATGIILFFWKKSTDCRRMCNRRGRSSDSVPHFFLGPKGEPPWWFSISRGLSTILIVGRFKLQTILNGDRPTLSKRLASFIGSQSRTFISNFFKVPFSLSPVLRVFTTMLMPSKVTGVR